MGTDLPCWPTARAASNLTYRDSLPRPFSRVGKSGQERDSRPSDPRGTPLGQVAGLARGQGRGSPVGERLRPLASGIHRGHTD